MNAARLEAHEAHKLRRAKMHAPAARLPPEPAVVLPMVRVVPEKLQAIRAHLETRRKCHQLKLAARLETRRKRHQLKLAARGEIREQKRLLRARQTAAVVTLVAQRYGVTVAEMCGPARSRRCSHPRQVAMALLHGVARRTLKDVAAALGRTHHTTALCALEAVRRRSAEDPAFAAEVAALGVEARRVLDIG